jgi:hypothetical protein
MQEISSTLIRQIQTEQQNTTTLLTNMMTQRDLSLDQKLNNQFELLLSKLGAHTTDSPARKKTTHTLDEDVVQQQSHAQIPMSCNQPILRQTATPDQTFINPYPHTAMRRRSVNTTLPTTES